MRTVYLGTSEFAAEVLDLIAPTRHRPVLVITPPDRGRGRGRKLSPTPVASRAEELGIEVFKAESVNTTEAAARVLDVAPEIGLVCAFGQLIKAPLLERLPMLNVHPSALPRWRGAAPLERAIMAGDATTEVCVMRLTEGLDSGPVALRALVKIGPGDTYGTLVPRLARLGARLLVEACDVLDEGELELVEQDESRATYAEKISAADRRIDPAADAVALERRVRALTPHIGAYLETLDGERLGVEAAGVIGEGAMSGSGSGAPSPGEVGRDDGRLIVACGEGALALERVKPPGKRGMDIGAYLRGHDPPARFACSFQTDD